MKNLTRLVLGALAVALAFILATKTAMAQDPVKVASKNYNPRRRR